MSYIERKLLRPIKDEEVRWRFCIETSRIRTSRNFGGLLDDARPWHLPKKLLLISASFTALASICSSGIYETACRVFPRLRMKL